ncbi:PocR ligand-binding domain-containing protein [Caldicellulosiruptoraceae bacterium PP1]
MRFKEIIKYDDLKKVLDNFSIVTGISTNFLTAENEWIENEKKGTCEFCKIMKQNYNGGMACRNSDIQGSMCAQQKKDIHIYKCHMGLTEVTIPLFFNNIFIGTLFIGQILDREPTPDMWDKIEILVSSEPIDISKLKDAFFKITYISEEKLMYVIEMLNIVAKYIIDSEMIRISSLSTIKKVEEYIKNNYMNNITLEDIANLVYLSPTYLSYLFKKQTGITFKEYLIGQRLKKAQELMDNTDYSIGEISKLVGIDDQNYFSRLFKAKYGISPLNYKKIKQNLDGY